MAFCNVLTPQMLWFKRIRRSLTAVFVISITVNVGMWFERFVIIVTSLSRDYLPSSWTGYAPTWIELGTLVGSFGLFFTCFLLFCRFLPMIAMAEVRAVVSEQEQSGHPAGHTAGEPVGAVVAAPERPGLRHFGAFRASAALLAAVRDGRARGLHIVDAHTPHPIHGLDAAMGLRRSRLPFVTLACGTVGVAIALWFQYWSSDTSWPLDVGGKPFDSLPAFVPVAFEMLVLLAGLGTAAALIVRCRLKPGGMEKVAPDRATDDRFVLVVERANAALSQDEVAQLWTRHGAVEAWTEHP
jgi:molybdopterin-containing oxidoreductase family membrane subunit